MGLGFDDSFDDSFLGHKTTDKDDANDDANEALVKDDSAVDSAVGTTKETQTEIETTDTSDETTDVIVIEDTDVADDYSEDMKKYLQTMGLKKMIELLPKVPSLASGMKLLGVPELNPLHKSGEVYKLRLCRPDFPIGFSEAWDDRTTLRMTNFAKLISEDVQMTNFRVEIASLVPGIQDEDVVGTRGMTELFEATAVCTLTMKPFIQRKVTGKLKWKASLFTIHYSSSYYDFKNWLV